ncbi:hypothetical protein [Holospora elegans]|nr:hypothetical protein [Holospora elegans]
MQTNGGVDRYFFNEKRFIFSLKDAGAWNNFIKTCPMIYAIK